MTYSLNIELNQPAADEFEITVLGPGRASGESLVIHLCNGEWMIIDSCVSGDVVLPLAYLNSLHVDPHCVKTVICTHWHTDHVLGLPEVLNTCENAELYIAPAGDFKGTLNYILQFASIETIDGKIWRVFDKCLQALAKNKRPRPHYLGHNEPVFTPKPGTLEMHALGPADDLLSSFMATLAQIDPNNPEATKIKELEGNLCSLALSLNYVGQKVLIGGDMEVGRKDKYNHSKCAADCANHDVIGWCDVLENSKIYPAHRPYDYIKLPHHSSVTGYCPKMWKEDMNAPIGVTTAFECKGKDIEDLPRKDMLVVYSAHCSELYVTCGNDAEGGTVGSALKHDISSKDGIEVIEKIEETYGAVVGRWKPGNEKWNIQLFGEGNKVNAGYLSNYHSK